MLENFDDGVLDDVSRCVMFWFRCHEEVWRCLGQVMNKADTYVHQSEGSKFSTTLAQKSIHVQLSHIHCLVVMV